MLSDDFHAFLFVGSEQTAKVLFDQLINKYGIISADIISLEPEIDDDRGPIKVEAAKNFSRQMKQSALGGSKVGKIWQAERLNAASGNVLLKILEEPPKNTYLYMWSKTFDVLPTIVSRCQVIGENFEQDDGEDLVNIFKNNFYEASSQIDAIVKEEKSKILLSQIARHLEKKMLISKSKKYAEALEIVFGALKKISTNANQRLVIENVYLKTRDLV